MQRRKIFSALTALLMLVLTTVASAADYRLQQVVVLSRHNIRAPLSGNDSELAKITPHKWFRWTSAPKELSLRGGELETLMGQYFRQSLVARGFMPENWQPRDGEVRFYANARQRTVATAQYFSSGMLPIANVRIEHKPLTGAMDPVFNPQLTFVSDKFRAEALRQINVMGGSDGLDGINRSLEGSYTLLEKVLDFDKSAAHLESGIENLHVADLNVEFELNREPRLTSSTKAAYLVGRAVDALILQYYEDPDAKSAAFGHKLKPADWERLANFQRNYGEVLFTAPIVAVNVAHPLLRVMSNELALDGRKFTFLCGHDSNIASVLAALEVESYFLPNSVEKKTPIGVKLVIEKYGGSDGQQYATLSLVYQSTEQLRARSMLNLYNPPEIFKLSLRGLAKNADGYYRLEDVQRRFAKAIDAYNQLQ